MIYGDYHLNRNSMDCELDITEVITHPAIDFCPRDLQYEDYTLKYPVRGCFDGVPKPASWSIHIRTLTQHLSGRCAHDHSARPPGERCHIPRHEHAHQRLCLITSGRYWHCLRMLLPRGWFRGVDRGL